MPRAYLNSHNYIVLCFLIFQEIPLSNNGCRIYVDIMTGEKLSSFYPANIELVYWSVRSSSRRGVYGVKRVAGGIVILASCKF